MPEPQSLPGGGAPSTAPQNAKPEAPKEPAIFAKRLKDGAWFKHDKAKGGYVNLATGTVEPLSASPKKVTFFEGEAKAKAAGLK
jgi:hypothetical protein